VNSTERVAEHPGGRTAQLPASSGSNREEPAGTVEVVPVRALLLGERLDTRALERNEPLGIAPLAVDIPEGGVAVVFRYGAVVLFGAATPAMDNFTSSPMDRAMISDLQLRRNVLDELEFEPAVDAAHIGVSANCGVVALTGFVASYAEKAAAERAARRVKGVTAIAQEIEIRLPSHAKRADDEIAACAVEILKWQAGGPADRIGIRVEKGIVTLTGEVDWSFRKPKPPTLSISSPASSMSSTKSGSRRASVPQRLRRRSRGRCSGVLRSMLRGSPSGPTVEGWSSLAKSRPGTRVT